MGEKMFTILYFILLCFKIFIAYEPYRASHVRATSFETVDSGYALQNHVIEVVHEYSPLDCGFACLQTADCQSYNTRQESSDVYECEMSSSTKTHHPNDFTAVAGVTYYGSDMFPGLGCAVVVCPNKNCRETKTYPYYHCPDDGFDLKFPSTRNHSAKGDDSSSLDKVSICFWCKTSQVKAPFLSYENNGHPPSLLNLVYSDGYVTLQINNKTAYDAVFPIPPIHDDHWHHVCTTWNSTNGHVNIFVDGALRTYPGKSYFKGVKVIPNGTFTIGYHRIDESEFGYSGKISQLNVWDHVLPSNKIQAIAKNCTMDHSTGGNVLKWGLSFAPTEQDTAEPRACSQRDQMESDYDLNFPGQGTKPYASLMLKQSLTKCTISWWLKTTWIPTTDKPVITILSAYHSTERDTLFVGIRSTSAIHFEQSGGEKSYHKIPPINDDRWHHMAITWDNADGKWEFYLDSVHRFSIDNFRTGQIVPSNSLIIIGQEQDEFSGGFSPDQALQGSLSRLNIWDTVLPVEVVVSFAKDPGYDNGNVLSWSFLRLRHHLSDIQASQPSNVVSSVGKSNVALTFSQMSNLNYAVLPYDGSIIAQLTVCTWIDLTASSTDASCLISYATSTSFNEFYIFFHESKCLISLESQEYEVGDDSSLRNKKWRHFCLTWDGVNGAANFYLEGKISGFTTSLPKQQTLSSPGIWAFTNDQDTYGGGFSNTQSIMSKIAQTNVWNHVLPNEAITAMSYGGTSIEGNLLRWSDVVASYNSDAYFTQHPFHLYLPDGVVQKRRDEFCRKNAPICPSGNTHYARIGLRHTNDPPGIQWRCYCPVNVGEDKNVQVVNDKYHTYEQLMYIF